MAAIPWVSYHLKKCNYSSSNVFLISGISIPALILAPNLSSKFSASSIFSQWAMNPTTGQPHLFHHAHWHEGKLYYKGKVVAEKEVAI